MKVTKKALLDAINTAYAKHDEDKARWDLAVEVWQDSRRAKWLANKGPEWKALRDLITKSLNKGQVLTTEMVTGVLVKPENRYGSSYLSDHTFAVNPSLPSKLRHPDGQTVTAPVKLPKDIEALKLFLESSPDETFSMESLSRLGFKAPAWVFRAAVGG